MMSTLLGFLAQYGGGSSGGGGGGTSGGAGYWVIVAIVALVVIGAVAWMVGRWRKRRASRAGRSSDESRDLGHAA